MEVIVEEKLEHEVSALRITKEKHEKDIQELKAMVEELRRPNSNCFLDYTQDSSCHGLRYIFRDRKINVRSCIWSTFVRAEFSVDYKVESFPHYIWCQCHKVTFNYEANKAKDKRIAPLVLNLQPSEYTYHEDGAEAYVVITFSEPSEYADPWKFDLLLEDGDIFDVRLEKQIESNLPAPYSSCLDTHARDFVSPLHHHGDYSYDACQLECESRQLQEQRGCRLIGVPSQNQTLAATCPISKSPMKTGVTCEHCRTPCTATKYAPFLVTRHRPARSHVKHLFVEFKDLRHTELTRSPAYPPEALLGDLGGNLGLLMGASALTVLEFVDVLAGMVWGKLVRNVNDATHA